jgi:putative PIN family toxin of toxin-antitoxin system
VKIAVDTNVLISAIIFNSSICKSILTYIPLEHTFIFTEEIINESLDTTFNKFSADAIKRLLDKKKAINNLEKIYDAILTASSIICLAKRRSNSNDSNLIRDPRDQAILNSLVKSGTEIFVTGDQDFFEHQYPNLKIMTPAQFAAEFIR